MPHHVAIVVNNVSYITAIGILVKGTNELYPGYIDEKVIGVLARIPRDSLLAPDDPRFFIRNVNIRKGVHFGFGAVTLATLTPDDKQVIVHLEVFESRVWGAKNVIIVAHTLEEALRAGWAVPGHRWERITSAAN